MKWLVFALILISFSARAQLGTMTRYTVPLNLTAPKPVPPQPGAGFNNDADPVAAAAGPKPTPATVAELPDDGPLTTGSLPSAGAPVDEPCPYEPAQSPSAKNARYASLLSMAAETGADPAFAQAYHHLRHCFSEKQRQKIGTGGMIEGLRQNIKARPPETTRKDDGTVATAEDWATVDVLTRALVGEVATTRGCGPEETKAVGKVILNRMDFVKASTNESWRIFANDRTGNTALDVLRKKNAFDAMKEKDKANRWLACPSADVVSKHNHGDGDFYTDSGAYDKWRTALHTAVDMVFHEQKFRAETADVKGFYYTANGASIGAGFKVTTAKINGKTINNPKCLQLFNPPAK